MWIKYYDVIKNMSIKNKFDIRLKMVKMAENQGISQTAEVYETTRNTVRKWLYRYWNEGLEGLKDKSRAPLSIPHKMPKQDEEKIVALRKKLPSWGQDRLKEEFSLPYSTKTINRVLKQNGLIKKRKKKWQKRRDLRKIKEQMKPFEKLQIDVKELRDIEHYFPQMIRHKLPQFQYTARDMKTGAIFMAYANSKDSFNASLFAAYISNHLTKYRIDMTLVVYQTDNGIEFIGNVKKKKGESAFEQVVKREFGIKHERIPPRCPTWNSDVEIFHKTIEDDLFEVEEFKNLEEFKAKTYTYHLYYNYKKKNRWRNRMSPYEILRSATNKIDPGILNLPPPILEEFYHHPEYKRGGYHVHNAVICRENFS